MPLYIGTKLMLSSDDDEEDVKPKMSEPFVRRLWTMAHQLVDTRSVGAALTRWSSTFSDCVVAYDMTEKVAALTIDDVPSEPALMHRMLDILKAHDVRATFFVVEEFARADEERLETLRRAVGEGHELANHLVRDESPANYTEEEFKEAFLKCDDLIASLVDGWRERKSKKWFRPPHGFMSKSIKATLDQYNYVAVLADVFPLDTEVRTPDWMVAFVKSQIKPGSILLLHAPDNRVSANGRKHKRQNNLLVLDRLLPDLKQNLHYTLTTLSDLTDRYNASLLLNSATTHEEHRSVAAVALA